MAIYRGDGGAGDATNDITINQITELSSDAQAAADAAASSATSASSSASAASTSATNAANSATAASTSETNAATSETNAATSASNASTSETNAAASETAAAASETAAGLSETAAAASETNAATSATNAATSETNANTSATSAASSASSASTSATNAATSETNAASSASSASTSATNAATSATSASNDAATATTKASEASTSATNAATSATNAATSETNAATSESNAATSETNAAASETAAASSASAAATSATNAATSASGAATSASNAATSASNASASADAALSALDNFDDRYLGQKTSDPTTDNDGDALVAGALYFNTTDDVMKVYEGSTWVAAYASLSGALLALNNLSDLNDTSTALTNLGIANHDDITVDGSGNVTVPGLLNVVKSSGFGAIEIGGTSGAYIDLKNPASDDYDGRIITTGTSLNLTTNAGVGAINLQHEGATKLSTTSTGIDVTGTVTADGADLDGAVVINESGANVDFRIESDTDINAFFLEGSNGSVGIGTSSPFSPLHLSKTSSSAPATSGNMSDNGITISNGLGGRAVQIGVDDASARSYIQAGYVNNANVASHLSFLNGANESMRIDSSGNVGIGTSSPTEKLDVDGNINFGLANAGRIYSTDGTRGSIQISAPNDAANRSVTYGNNYYLDSDNTYKQASTVIGGSALEMSATNGDYGEFFFRQKQDPDAGGAERVAIKIDSSGNLLVGTTSSSPGGASRSGKITLVHAGGSTTNGINVTTTAASSRAVEFQYTGYGVTGFIATGTNTTNYSTSSDYRLKEDWVAVADASTRVNALKPVNFAWKIDGTRVDGFLAHELAEVVPEAVTGEKDAVDAEGNPEYQGIDQSKLVPLLTAALQEAIGRIETLEAEVSALKEVL